MLGLAMLAWAVTLSIVGLVADALDAIAVAEPAVISGRVAFILSSVLFTAPTATRAMGWALHARRNQSRHPPLS